ncbi:hypothetical protein M426DRAFT_267632 [Hypoxylon sp. CI-4A]|nr:hypothetical protein M426DRAFT_267632 [Hypoxylon sp. CI-4A]
MSGYLNLEGLIVGAEGSSKKSSAKRSPGEGGSVSEPSPRDDLPFPLGVLKPGNSSMCGQVITRDCIRALYEFLKGYKSHADSQLSIYMTLNNYNQPDLDAYYKMFTSDVPKGTGPELRGIDGDYAPGALGQGQESSSAPNSAFLSSTHEAVSSTRQVTITTLEAIEGSYCTYSAYGETGNNPLYDYEYPHNVTATVLPPGVSASNHDEMAAFADTFKSTGAFSNIYTALEWQKDAIEKYFQVAYPYYETPNNESFGANGGIYNHAGRRLLDVGAAGYNMVFYMYNTTVHP